MFPFLYQTAMRSLKNDKNLLFIRISLFEFKLTLVGSFSLLSSENSLTDVGGHPKIRRR